VVGDAASCIMEGDGVRKRSEGVALMRATPYQFRGSEMAREGRTYKVKCIGKGLKKSYPLSEVKCGTRVKALESAPKGSLDVIDVRTKSGRVKSVYSFQLE